MDFSGIVIAEPLWHFSSGAELNVLCALKAFPGNSGFLGIPITSEEMGLRRRQPGTAWPELLRGWILMGPHSCGTGQRKQQGQHPSDISEPLMSSLTSWAIRSHQEGPPSQHSHRCASRLHPQPRRRRMRKGSIQAQAKQGETPTFHLLILEPAEGLVSSEDFCRKWLC